MRKPKANGTATAKPVNFKQLTEKEKEQTFNQSVKTGASLKKKLAAANLELDNTKADSQLQIADLEAKLQRALTQLAAKPATAATTDATAMEEDGKGDAVGETRACAALACPSPPMVAWLLQLHACLWPAHFADCLLISPHALGLIALIPGLCPPSLLPCAQCCSAPSANTPPCIEPCKGNDWPSED
ncbi:MAG: hypothetical protein EOM68_19800 [Spirochaetia bacterium]|nr:hypothetical protein [Spirochaetia bacterium]